MPRQFFVAMVPATSTVFGPEHYVKDFRVESFLISHKEAGIPTLDLNVKNIGGGLLAPGRNQWCWFSWDDGAGTVTPLFFGRLIAIPTSMFKQHVKLSFVAKPLDYEAQKIALMTALKVAPNWDEVFIKAEEVNNPDTVLQGYARYWHVGRTPSDPVTTSDILIGEDSTEDFQENEIDDASVDTTVGQPPRTRIDITMNVPWKQAFTDVIDMGSLTINSYSGDGILADWFKPGQELAGGYEVAYASTQDVFGTDKALTATWSFNYNNNQKEHISGDVLTISESVSKPEIGPGLSKRIITRFQIGIVDPFSEPPLNIPAISNVTTLTVAKYQIITTLGLRASANRPRTEKVHFIMQSDIQAVMTDEAATDSTEYLTLDGRDVGVALSDSTVPIGDTSNPSFFTQARGNLSLEYGLAVGLAHLRLGARVAQTIFDCKFERGINLNCRKNAVLHSRRFPGGQIIGKITQYDISGDGAGNMRCKVTMMSAVGRGNIVEEVAGTPSYVEDGVLDPGIQYMDNQIVLLTGYNTVGYTPPAFAALDDLLRSPITKDQILVRSEIIGTIQQQELALADALDALESLTYLQTLKVTSEQASIDQQQRVAALNTHSVSAVLKANPIRYELELKSLDAGFDNQLEVPVLPITIEKMIDLEALQIAYLTPVRIIDNGAIFSPGVQ